MESTTPATERVPTGGGPELRLWPTLLKLAIGILLLVLLLVFGRIDFKALYTLIDTPDTVATAVLLLVSTIPLAAVRWGLILRATGLSIGFVPLVYFIAMGTVSNSLLLGPAGGDAVRGVYAWRALERGAGRIAASILIDRILGLVGLTSLALCFTILNWDWMRRMPALYALGTSLVLTFIGGGVGACVLLAAPRFSTRLERHLAPWPRIATLVAHARNLILMLWTAPRLLVTAFILSVIIHIANIGALLVLADALNIGQLKLGDYVLATALALVTHALPLTPNGIGIGEAAFDQICRWLEPNPSGAAYSSIFFAYRAASIVASLPGLLSFVIYRKTPSPRTSL